MSTVTVDIPDNIIGYTDMAPTTAFTAAHLQETALRSKFSYTNSQKHMTHSFLPEKMHSQTI